MVSPDIEAQLQNEYWMIAHVKANQERNVSRDMLLEEIPHFFPTTQKRNLRTRKFRDVPLFPGYVFFAGDVYEKRIVNQNDRVANVIQIEDQDTLKSELIQVFQALQTGLTIDPLKDLVIGKKCRIIAGPGMGLIGKIDNRKGNSKIILEISSITQGIMIEIDPANIELLNED